MIQMTMSLASFKKAFMHNRLLGILTLVEAMVDGSPFRMDQLMEG
jgi:hypothetical protein